MLDLVCVLNVYYGGAGYYKRWVWVCENKKGTTRGEIDCLVSHRGTTVFPGNGI